MCFYPLTSLQCTNRERSPEPRPALAWLPDGSTYGTPFRIILCFGIVIMPSEWHVVSHQSFKWCSSFHLRFVIVGVFPLSYSSCFFFFFSCFCIIIVITTWSQCPSITRCFSWVIIIELALSLSHYSRVPAISLNLEIALSVLSLKTALDPSLSTQPMNP